MRPSAQRPHNPRFGSHRSVCRRGVNIKPIAPFHDRESDSTRGGDASRIFATRADLIARPSPGPLAQRHKTRCQLALSARQNPRRWKLSFRKSPLAKSRNSARPLRLSWSLRESGRWTIMSFFTDSAACCFSRDEGRAVLLLFLFDAALCGGRFASKALGVSRSPVLDDKPALSAQERRRFAQKSGRDDEGQWRP
jgi:hypothetical protein